MDCTRDSLWTCGTAVNQKRCVRTVLVIIYIYSISEYFLRFYLNVARETRIFSALLIRGSLGNVKLRNSWGYSCSMRLYMNIKFNEQYPQSVKDKKRRMKGWVDNQTKKYGVFSYGGCLYLDGMFLNIPSIWVIIIFLPQLRYIVILPFLWQVVLRHRLVWNLHCRYLTYLLLYIQEIYLPKLHA